MSHTSKNLPYILGLDLGIASIGWAVTETKSFTSFEPKRLYDAGVRIFPTAEVPKTGESPNVARRLARSNRRRLRRRRMRLSATADLLSSLFDITQDSIRSTSHADLWELRILGLDRRLTDLELAKVLYHIIKHRGFKSSRKDLVEEKASDSQKQKTAIETNSKLLESKKYRTFAEMISSESKSNPVFGGRKRNSVGSYAATPTRKQLVAELQLILQAQRAFGHTEIDTDIEGRIIDLMNRQKSFASRDDIIEKVGNCTLIPTEKRASRHSFSVELFRVWQDLNNLSFLNKMGAERELDQQEKNLVIDALLESGEISFKKVRKLLSISPDWHYKYLKTTKSKQDQTLDVIEADNHLSLETYHQLRLKIQKIDEPYWLSISKNPDALDQIIFELTVCPTSAELQDQLSLLNIPLPVVDAILKIPSKTGFIHLSLAAVKRLLPHLQSGSKYDEACLQAGLIDSASDKLSGTFFRPITQDDITNPVVLRAVTQTRKLVKAVVAKYGAPLRIHIELARELSKSREKRNEIDKLQKEREAAKQADRAILESSYNIASANGTQILKYRLWKEQNYQCAYSGKPISEEVLFNDENATQIDHALPMSRTLDDSYLNKVLVLTEENQLKRDQTPFEYLGGAADQEKWNAFVQRVESWRIPFKKKSILLKQNIPSRLSDIEQTFNERALNDTRYISRFIKNYLESNCPFSSKDRRRVIVITGSITAFFRNHWGLSKSRDNDRHHAIDAVVVTAVSSAMLAEVIGWAKQREQNRSFKTDRYFPDPWPMFNKDLRYRILEDRIDDFWANAELKALYSDIPEQIKLLLISRAPNRKMTSSIHGDTLFSSSPANGSNLFSIRKPLAIPIQVNWNGQKVLQKSQIVTETANSLVRVPRGNAVVIAKNPQGSMLRIDIFTSDGKFYIIPIYAHQAYEGVLPNKVICSGKNESDWRELTPDDIFMFSLYKNDYILIDNGIETGAYYSTAHSGTGNINLISHDGGERIDGVGIRRLKKFEKYEIDLLGNRHLVKHEIRNPLKLKTNKRH